MKSIITLSILALAFLFSCQKDKKMDKDEPTKEALSTENELDLQTFSELPELADCNTYIARNEEAYEKGEFIYADDYGNNAYIKIGDKLITIPLDEGDFDPSDNIRTIEWKEGNISFDIAPLIAPTGEEEVLFKGVMKIQVDGKVYQTPVYGKYSC